MPQLSNVMSSGNGCWGVGYLKGEPGINGIYM